MGKTKVLIPYWPQCSNSLGHRSINNPTLWEEIWPGAFDRMLSDKKEVLGGYFIAEEAALDDRCILEHVRSEWVRNYLVCADGLRVTASSATSCGNCCHMTGRCQKTALLLNEIWQCAEISQKWGRGDGVWSEHGEISSVTSVGDWWGKMLIHKS